jgi:hypothetical protein
MVDRSFLVYFLVELVKIFVEVVYKFIFEGLEVKFFLNKEHSKFPSILSVIDEDSDFVES